MLLELLLYILKTITETKERRVFQDTEFLQPKLNQNLNQIQNQFFFILDPLCQFLREKNFFKNRVLKVFRFHIYVPSCKKLEKQNKEPLPRKTANQQADRYLSFHRTFSFGEGGGGGGAINWNSSRLVLPELYTNHSCMFSISFLRFEMLSKLCQNIKG